eukprot:3807791-Rhodomonas_salina.2
MAYLILLGQYRICIPHFYPTPVPSIAYSINIRYSCASTGQLCQYQALRRGFSPAPRVLAAVVPDTLWCYKYAHSAVLPRLYQRGYGATSTVIAPYRRVSTWGYDDATRTHTARYCSGHTKGARVLLAQG